MYWDLRRDRLVCRLCQGVCWNLNSFRLCVLTCTLCWPAQRSRIKVWGCVCCVYGHNSIEMIVFLMGMIQRQSFLELYNVCSGWESKRPDLLWQTLVSLVCLRGTVCGRILYNCDALCMWVNSDRLYACVVCNCVLGMTCWQICCVCSAWP